MVFVINIIEFARFTIDQERKVASTHVRISLKETVDTNPEYPCYREISRT